MKQYRAALVGTSPLHHLAVLLITDVPQECLLPIQLGANADVQVGQAAYVCGLKFGSKHSLSLGVVSGLRRPLQAAPGAGPGLMLPGGALQTDASVDAYSTGGALVDSAGRLMGLAVLPNRRSPSSLSFAVPVDVLRSVVPRLIAGVL
jgi:S1-C subfamily serine protease